MNKLCLLLATALTLASSACDARKKGAAAASSPVAGYVAVRPPNGDWSQSVVPSTGGGFIMGNPNAPAKLIEFGSMSCPHCAAFEKEGVPSLISKYVKTGKVSWEFRNFIRDSYDLSAALVARCNGAKSFFGLTRGIYATQPEWVAKLQAIPQPQMEAMMNLPPQQQFATIAKVAGFPQFAALRGVPVAKANTCLVNQNEVNKLVQMTSDATSQYNIPGTPGFVLNGALLADTATWETLEPKLKAASGG